MNKISIFKSLILLCFVSYVDFVMAQNTFFPYYCGFDTEEELSEWTCKSRVGLVNKFVVDSAIHLIGAKSLYISADDGETFGSEMNETGFVNVAYHHFTFSEGEYRLIFDYIIKGNSDVDFLKIALYPDSVKVTDAVVGDNFPKLSRLYTLYDDLNLPIELTTVSGWTRFDGSFNIKSGKSGGYNLVFLYKVKQDASVKTDLHSGVAIDNIQITYQWEETDCEAMPTDLAVKFNADGDVEFSWKGNADSYDVIYYNTSYRDTSYTLVKDVKSTSYVVPYLSLEEGVYNFRVRAKCGKTASLWNEVCDFFIYHLNLHCIDYVTLQNTELVDATYGWFLDPYSNHRVVDYGQDSKESLHTIHTRSDERDRLTGYQLRKVPEGKVASLRIGSWKDRGGVNSSSVSYKYPVCQGSEVLLIQYAAVLQFDPWHAAEAQTRILVEVLDDEGELLSECTQYDFNARYIADYAPKNWHTYQPKVGEVTWSEAEIKWSDWEEMGINLYEFVGDTVNIRLTIYACGDNFHFAYGYFTLDCAGGTFDGLSCSDTPTEFVAPSGFNYRWYRASDLDNVISTEQIFKIEDPMDTTTYMVDIVPKDRPECYYTIPAYTVPRLPRTDMVYSIENDSCQNKINFFNKSKVVRVVQGVEELEPQARVESFYWDFGIYGESYEIDPSIVIPNEGDTFSVVLRSMYHGCEDIDTFIVEVPAINYPRTDIYKRLCFGEVYTLNGNKYMEGGVYYDTISIVSGCDSIVCLHLDFVVADTLITLDTIYSDDLPYDFYGQQIMSEGYYEYVVLSENGCDSIYYKLNLMVLPSIDVRINPTDICADQLYFEIPLDVANGVPEKYDIVFDEYAKKAGFIDVGGKNIVGDFIVVDMPKDIRPDNYEAELKFYDQSGEVKIVNYPFTVMYDSDIIAQRWNDFLGVKNENYNGGYCFSAYQWFVNDVPVEGFTLSQYYVEGESLDFESQYRVLLTRIDDGKSIMTCAFVPTKFKDDELTKINTITFVGSIEKAMVPRAGVAYIYSLSGILNSVISLVGGENYVEMPEMPGMYIMRIVYDEGDVQVIDIMVKQ